MKVLLSIKPDFAARILNGSKRFEYRRVVFREPVDTIVLYASSPVSLVVGEFHVQDLYHEPLDALWRRTCKYSGISRDFFYQYFGSMGKGYAIEIGSTHKYSSPMPLNQIYQFRPPQSFAYLRSPGRRTTC
jgi:predicted transcriptional regulator